MKSILKRKYIAYILSLLMIVGIFLPYGRALAEEGANYSIKMDVNINNKNKLEEELTDDKNNKDEDFKGLVLKSSQREVKVYKLKEGKELTDEDKLELVDKYHKLSIKEIEENHVDGLEEVTSAKSYLVYNDKTKYQADDEVWTKDIEDFDLDKIKEEIEINDLEAGYYLIKETDESKEKSKKGANSELVTHVVKLPNDEMSENILTINAKEDRKVDKKDLSLVKVDYDRPDIKLDNVEFELYRKSEDSNDKVITVDGKNGDYLFNEEGETSLLKTNKDGKIVVKNLPEGSYYFKEKTSYPGYDKDNVESKGEIEAKFGETVTVKNKITPIFTKIDADKKDEYLQGAKFRLYKEDGTLIKFRKDKAYYEVDPNGKAEEIVTGENGNVYIHGLEDGKYYLEETKAPEGYVASKTKIGLDIKGSRYLNDKGEIDIKQVENKAYKNGNPSKAKGGFNFVKIDSTEKAKRLGGAKFILLKKEGDKYVEVKQDGKNISLVSKDNGEFKIDNLEYGKYALKEVEAPKNHYITQELTLFEVGAGSISKPAIKIKNEPYKPTTVTSKDNTITTKHTPGGMTRVVKSPLVKTGDIRIVIMAIAGFILLLIGRRLVRNDERLQRI